MKTYLALTTGPIVKTLLNTRHTRELWGASYLFSRIMRDIICKLIQENAIKRENILLPYPDLFEWNACPPKWSSSLDNDENIKQIMKLGTGLFPDRLYILIDEDQKTNILQKTQKAANEALEKIDKLISSVKSLGLKNTLNELQQYFQIYFLLKELPEDENIIFSLSPLLDTLELQSNFPREDEKKSLFRFLDRINESEELITEAFGGYKHPAHPAIPEVTRFGFDSLVEVSTRELGYINKVKNEYSEYLIKYLKKIGVFKDSSGKDSKESEETKNIPTDIKDELLEEKEFLAELSRDSTFEDHFRTYHKYVAIVYADGDNVGSILEEIGTDPEQIRTFSEKLTRFAARAALKIHQYGGAPVYAGGDDLLFFAPVSMMKARQPGDKNGYHIFDLLEMLDQEFKTSMAEYSEHNPSLSFGVSITYYAFPMGESLEQARYHLFGIAKKVPGKNALAYTIQKHSGNQFGGIFNFHSQTYQHFKKIMNHDPDTENEKEMLKSVVYKLRASEGLLAHIGKEPQRVANFMVNSFNESIHLDDDGNLRPYLQWVGELIPAVYTDVEKIQKHLQGSTAAEKSIHQLFGLLRTVSFLKGEEI